MFGVRVLVFGVCLQCLGYGVSVLGLRIIVFIICVGRSPIPYPYAQATITYCSVGSYYKILIYEFLGPYQKKTGLGRFKVSPKYNNHTLNSATLSPGIRDPLIPKP